VSAFWTVPGGFTNTGLCTLPDGTLAIGNYDSGTIVITDKYGALISTITLASPPSASVQGVAWDSSRSCFWVCHRDLTAGTIRRYNTSGVLQQTITPGVGTAGPNGCAYDLANDRVLTLWDDAIIRGYPAAGGSVAETITCDATLGSGSGAGPDGLVLDPTSPASFVWVSADLSAQKIAKLNRSTGAIVSSFTCARQAESLAFLDSYIYLCSDQLFHDGLANGNRVYRYTEAGLPVALQTRFGSFAGVYG
jgi:streptogramin lyase